MSSTRTRRRRKASQPTEETPESPPADPFVATNSNSDDSDKDKSTNDNNNTEPKSTTPSTRRSSRLKSKPKTPKVEKESKVTKSIKKSKNTKSKVTAPKTTERKRGRPKKMESSSPPKKKRKLSPRGKKADLISPSFVDDVDYLVSVGIIRQKETKTRTGKIKKGRNVYRREATTSDKTYKWSTSKKYHLEKVLDHKMEYDMETCLEDGDDKLWYETLQVGVDSAESSGGDEVKVKESDSNRNGNSSDSLQCTFGRLRFECQYTDWPDTSWESWSTIVHTKAFKDYCGEMEWNVKRELEATFKAIPAEKVKEIMRDMSLWAPPSTRKALKQLVLTQFDVW